MIVGVGVDVLVDVGEGGAVAKIIGVGVDDGPIVGVSVAARTIGVRVSVNVGDGSRVDVAVEVEVLGKVELEVGVPREGACECRRGSNSLEKLLTSRCLSQ